MMALIIDKTELKDNYEFIITTIIIMFAVAEKNGRSNTRSCDELLKNRRCKSLSALKENINEVLATFNVFSQFCFMHAAVKIYFNTLIVKNKT